MDQDGEYTEVSIKTAQSEIRIRGSEAFVSSFLEDGDERIERVLNILENRGRIPKAKKSNVTKEKRKTRQPTVSKAPIGAEPSDWVNRVCEASSCTERFIRDAFVFSDKGLVLVDWDVGRKDVDKIREIATVVVLANEQGLKLDEVPVAVIKASLSRLKIPYDGKSLARQLSGSDGLATKETGSWSVNQKGRNTAIAQLRDRAQQVGAQTS